MCREKFSAKGEIIIFYSNKEIMTEIKDYKDENEKNFGQKTIYELYKGKDFLEKIESKDIIPCTGEILNIFIDGYVSNLGLHYKGLSQGRFLVDKETFLKICKNHEVKINWAKK